MLSTRIAQQPSHISSVVQARRPNSRFHRKLGEIGVHALVKTGVTPYSLSAIGQGEAALQWFEGSVSWVASRGMCGPYPHQDQLNTPAFLEV